MEKRPGFGEVDVEVHYFRNNLNIEYEWDDFVEMNCRLPEKYQWRQMPPPYDGEHQNTATEGKPNRKYVSFDGYFEAVYSYDNVLLNEETASLDMGTYNYEPSGNSIRKHVLSDLFTFYRYTNTKEDWEKKLEEISLAVKYRK